MKLTSWGFFGGFVLGWLGFRFSHFGTPQGESIFIPGGGDNRVHLGPIVVIESIGPTILSHILLMNMTNRI